MPRKIPISKAFRSALVLFFATVSVGLVTIHCQAMQGMSPQKSQPHTQQPRGGGIDWGRALAPLFTPQRGPMYYPPMIVPGDIGGPSSGGSMDDDDPSVSSGSGSDYAVPRKPEIPAQHEPTPTARSSTSDLFKGSSGNSSEPTDARPPEKPMGAQDTPTTDTNTLLTQSPGNTRLPTDLASDADPPRTTMLPPTQPTPTAGTYVKDTDGQVKTSVVSKPDPVTGIITVTVTTQVGDSQQTNTFQVPPGHYGNLQGKLDSYIPPAPPTAPPETKPLADQPSTAPSVPPHAQAKLATLQDAEKKAKNIDLARTGVNTMINQDLPTAASTWGKRVVDPNDPANSLGGGKDAFPAENQLWGKADTYLPGLRNRLQKEVSGNASEFNKLKKERERLEDVKRVQENKDANRDAVGPHITPSGHEVETSMGPVAMDLPTINQKLEDNKAELQKWTTPAGVKNKQVRDAATQLISKEAKDKSDALDKEYNQAAEAAKTAKMDFMKSLQPPAGPTPQLAQPSPVK